MVVSGGMVMLRKVGAGGGGGGAGGAGGSSCTGGGGGGAAATSGAGVSAGGGGGAWRTTGAGFGLIAGGCFGLGATGIGAGGVAAATAGGGAWTVRLLTTVLIPKTCAASAAARERAASLLTLPVRVATPVWTEDWIDSLLRAPSLAIRLCRAALRLASSIGAAGILLQPPKPTNK